MVVRVRRGMFVAMIVAMGVIMPMRVVVSVQCVVVRHDRQFSASAG